MRKKILRPLHRADLTASVAVSLLLLPQAMAYALIAGVPLASGVLCAIFGTALVALVGSSHCLVTGPTNATAILVSASLASIMARFSGLSLLPLLATMTLLIGCVQLLVAALQLGRLTYTVSRTVILGYLTGVMMAVTVGQLFVGMGIHRPIASGPIAIQYYYLIQHIAETHLATMVLTLVCLLSLIGMKRLVPKAPSALIMILATTGLVIYGQRCNWPWVSELSLVREMGDLIDLTPEVIFPYVSGDLLWALLPSACIIALLGIVETAAVSRSVSARSGLHSQANREVWALGIANMTIGWFAALPSSASASRTALNYEAGAVSRVSALLSAGWVALMVMVFGPWIGDIPQAALAALLLYSVTGKIVQPRQFHHYLTQGSEDAIVLCFTVFWALFIALDVSFYAGLALSLAFRFQRKTTPEVVG